MKKIIIFTLSAVAAFGQATTTQTTFSSAVTTTADAISLTSCTGTVAPSQPTVQASFIVADMEAMRILSVITGTIGGSGACTLNVRRGMLGSRRQAHGVLANVYIAQAAVGSGGTANPYTNGALAGSDPSGACVSASQYSLPVIAQGTWRVWTCPSSGPMSGYWAVVYDPQSQFQFTDAVQWVPATAACNSSVSGNSTGTNGLTVVGASNVPVIQAQTSSTGTNTHYYTCSIPIPTRTRSAPASGVAISDIHFVYGVQTTALGTQVNTLASGTLNSTIVFGKVTLPAAAASETATTVAPARADSGTLVITPAVASFNTGTTTAGAFYTAKFAPATPVAMNTDLTIYTFTVALLNTATSATITNSLGLYVHYVNVPL